MSAPHIESYHFGEMVVDGEAYTDDLILLSDRVIPGWWRDEGHRLQVQDLEDVFDARPEILVVGTGANGVMTVPEETQQAVRKAGIELRVTRTGDAWHTYNELQDDHSVAGAFHLTC
jgi:hypothetical protein